jgi:glycosyltransferase involved in cell wall biosynthesis
MKIKLTHPLISCLCVTDNRPDMLLKAIVNFDIQNYPNKELVISYPKTDRKTKELIEEISNLSDLRLVQVERTNDISLGQAKNNALIYCNGDYICTWDDDDWYHYNRITHQYNNMQVNGKYRQASILTKIMMYDEIKDLAWHSSTYDWGCTLLCRKDLILKYPFADENIAEDTLLVKQLYFEKRLHVIADCAFLYLHVYHGQNAMDYFHFYYLANKSELLDQESKSWIKSLINTQVNLLNVQ